ncbi:MAG: hypothetical protein ACI9TY_001136 [Alphaproteobacteria bacterium]|jgi:hypothetical protein
MTLNTSTFIKITDEQVTSIDFDDAVFAEMSELDTLAIESFIAFPQKFSAAAIKRSRSKHPTGRGEQKKSVQWFHRDEWDISLTKLKATENRKPSIAEGMEDYLNPITGFSNGTLRSHDSQEHQDHLYYLEDHDMLCDEADDSVGDIAVLNNDSIIDKLIASLSADAGEDTLEQRLATNDAQMLSEYIDEDKEWTDYQAIIAKKSVNTEMEAGSFAEDNYQDDADAGHYISTSSPEFLQSACGDEDGDIHLYNDDPEFYTRQECGSVFEDQECHIPPAIESRFDILGGAGARNMYASNPKWTGLTGFRYLMNH